MYPDILKYVPLHTLDEAWNVQSYITVGMVLDQMVDSLWNQEAR